MKKIIRLGFIFFFLILSALIIFVVKNQKKEVVIPLPSPIATFLPTPTPTPKLLTFTEMNSLYGPCVYLPTLMYHHVQDKEVALAKKQTALTVNTSDFRVQMEYLRDKGYTVIGINDLINFFDRGIVLPSKSVLITFDDAYSDIYVNAFPVLKEFNYSAMVFVPTGLVNNSDYLSWNQIAEMAQNRIYFGNHTWSHKNVSGKGDIFKIEIQTGDSQLEEKGLNNPKIFAYPYGTGKTEALSFLESLNYKAAFTTNPGKILCKKERLILPRLRIGNGNLDNYGL